MNAIAKHIDENQVANVVTRSRNVKANPIALLFLDCFESDNDKATKNEVYFPNNGRLELFLSYIQQLIATSLGKSKNEIQAYLQLNNNLFTVKEKSQYIGHEEDIYIHFHVIQHLTANGGLSATNSDSVTKYRFG